MQKLFTKIRKVIGCTEDFIYNSMKKLYNQETLTLIMLLLSSSLLLLSSGFIISKVVMDVDAVSENVNNSKVVYVTTNKQTTTATVMSITTTSNTTTKETTNTTTVTTTTETETSTVVETTIVTETTTAPIIIDEPIVTEEYMIFKPYTHYVHRSTCRWCKDEFRVITCEDDIGEPARYCTECNPEIEITNVYYPPEPIQLENDNSVNIEYNNDGVLLGTYQATWYTAVDMGYSKPPKGASGRVLETAYSCASNSIPQGSIIRIEGGGIDGVYRVDDRGGMANNVIDMYYYDRSSIPASFKNAGRINIQVYLLE